MSRSEPGSGFISRPPPLRRAYKRSSNRFPHLRVRVQNDEHPRADSTGIDSRSAQSHGPRLTNLKQGRAVYEGSAFLISNRPEKLLSVLAVPTILRFAAADNTISLLRMTLVPSLHTPSNIVACITSEAGPKHDHDRGHTTQLDSTPAHSHTSLRERT
jgi:hypothetical protein